MSTRVDTRSGLATGTELAGMPTLMLTTATLPSPVASATAYWKVSVPTKPVSGL